MTRNRHNPESGILFDVPRYERFANIKPFDASKSLINKYLDEASVYPLLNPAEEVAIGCENVLEWKVRSTVQSVLFASCSRYGISPERVSAVSLSPDDSCSVRSVTEIIRNGEDGSVDDYEDSPGGIPYEHEGMERLIQTVADMRPKDSIVSRVWSELDRMYPYEFRHHMPGFPGYDHDRPQYTHLIDALEEIKVRIGRLRRQLIHSNLRLVVSLTRRYLHKGIPMPDLVQEGNLGLIRAVNTYDDRGNRFSTYAGWWIRQAITRSIADKTNNIRVPVHANEKNNQIGKFSDRFYARYGREPTKEELSEATGMEPDKIMMIRSRVRNSCSISYDAEDEEGKSLKPYLPDTSTYAPSDPIECEQRLSKINEVLELIGDKRLENVLRLRFGIPKVRKNGAPMDEIDWLIDKNPDGMTLEQVGKKFKVTRERIRQLENQGLRMLRHPSRRRGLEEFIE